MAGGVVPLDSSPVVNGFAGKITLSVIITCLVAASSGLIFGYDVGISGGVTTMVPFLEKFFPDILRKMASAEVNMYCVYDSQILTLFTSSLYLAGLVSSVAASRITIAFGRRNVILFGGIVFLVGSALNGGAENIAMLILGRILLGFGVGFTNQAAPLYLSEIAPPKWRGAFNAGFNFFVGIGVVAAGCINFGTAKHTWGWRVSLGLAVVPAAVMTMGALLITDTPSSLVERGKIDQARRALHKARGSSIDVEPELEELIKWSKIAKSVEQEPFKTIFERQYRPHLVMAIAITFFQQLTGINVVAFYAPNLFQSVGLGHDAALFSAIILGAVNLASIVLGTAIVDRFGRRFLFITGGTCMFVTQVSKWSINFFKLFIILLGLFDTLLALIITIFVMTTVKLVLSIVLAVVTGVHGTKDISNGNAIVVLVLLSLYTASFGGSWGSLTWLIPSEIFPLKIRSTGQSIAIAVQFVTIFIVSQTFLTMLCHFKFGAFVFYAGWIVVMTIFIIFFLPETKGIPLESMYIVWSKHWFWGRFVKVPQENLP